VRFKSLCGGRDGDGGPASLLKTDRAFVLAAQNFESHPAVTIGVPASLLHTRHEVHAGVDNPEFPGGGRRPAAPRELLGYLGLAVPGRVWLTRCFAHRNAVHILPPTEVPFVRIRAGKTPGIVRQGRCRSGCYRCPAPSRVGVVLGSHRRARRAQRPDGGARREQPWRSIAPYRGRANPDRRLQFPAYPNTPAALVPAHPDAAARAEVPSCMRQAVVGRSVVGGKALSRSTRGGTCGDYRTEPAEAASAVYPRTWDPGANPR